METNEQDVLLAKALELFEERQAEKAKKAAELEAIQKEAYAKGLEEGEKKAKTWIEEKVAPTHMKKAKPGSGGQKGDMDTFVYFLKTGDEVAAKASLEMVKEREAGIGVDEESRKALSSGTGAAGEYLVPDDFNDMIIPKRDAASFVRKMGPSVFNTSLRVVDLPAESTSLTKFTRTAELGTYSTNDPAFAQNQVTVQKWTKVTRFSEEILDDNEAGLMEWYANAIGRAMAQTEAYYVAIGSGSNQHEGIFEGGDTDAFTYNTDVGMDSDFAAPAPSAIWNHYFDLGEGYRENAVWLASGATLASILSFRSAKALEWASADLLTISGGQISLCGRPFYTQGDIPAKGSGVGFIAFGDPFYYTLVERKGLTVARNPYLYQASGEIAVFSSFRQSGKVTVEEAWNIGVGA